VNSAQRYVKYFTYANQSHLYISYKHTYTKVKPVFTTYTQLNIDQLTVL